MSARYLVAMRRADGSRVYLGLFSTWRDRQSRAARLTRAEALAALRYLRGGLAPAQVHLVRLA